MKRTEQPCSIEFCDRKCWAKNLCAKHYNYQKFLKVKDTLEYKALRKKASSRYYLKNTSKILKYSKEWIKLNKERAAATRKNYSDNHKSMRCEIARRYQKRNPDKVKVWKRISLAHRRARLLKAMPSWLSKDQKKEISKFYKNCPIGYQVDHIIPLCSKIVCGLHVPWNLQYLTPVENLKKGNKLILKENSLE